MPDAHVELSPQEAIIYLMVMASASDGEIRETELRTIGRVVRSFTLFDEADENGLVETSQAAGRMMSGPDGLQNVLGAAKAALPAHLAETAYAAVIDVISADEGLTGTEIRVMELIRDTLGISDEGATALERAARARHMTLTPPEV